MIISSCNTSDEGGQMSNDLALNEKRYAEGEVIALRLIPGITNRITLHRKRKAGLIGFYQIGNKIFYSESHICDFLAQCEQKAKGAACAAPFSPDSHVPPHVSERT